MSDICIKRIRSVVLTGKVLTEHTSIFSISFCFKLDIGVFKLAETGVRSGFAEEFTAKIEGEINGM